MTKNEEEVDNYSDKQIDWHYGSLREEGCQLLRVLCFCSFGPLQSGELKMKFLHEAKTPEGL